MYREQPSPSARHILRSVKVTKHGTISYVRYGFLLVFYSNFVTKMHRFWDIRLWKNVVALKSGTKVTQGHRDIRRFQSKIMSAPSLTAFPSEIGIGALKCTACNCANASLDLSTISFCWVNAAFCLSFFLHFRFADGVDFDLYPYQWPSAQSCVLDMMSHQR